MEKLRWAISIFLMVLSPLPGFCDGESFDIITIRKGGQIYHFRIVSQGMLQNNDLCYYTYEGEYVCEVKDVVKNSLPKFNHFGYYYNRMERISLINIPNEYNGNGILYILKDTISLDPDSVLLTLNIVSAVNEYKYMNTYTPDLNEKDNAWLESNAFEALFPLNFETCEMNLFSIKGKLTLSEKENLKTKLEAVIRKNSWEIFEEELRNLYKRKIIMLGDCHC